MDYETFKQEMTEDLKQRLYERVDKRQKAIEIWLRNGN